RRFAPRDGLYRQFRVDFGRSDTDKSRQEATNRDISPKSIDRLAFFARLPSVPKGKGFES
ncbi:MAG: hypothetical protein NTU60_01425, partial [Candidatus Aminicenantes bacterium]|nr:hypothetical protein [Candidatus Aminicenantes bacterium]